MILTDWSLYKKIAFLRQVFSSSRFFLMNLYELESYFVIFCYSNFVFYHNIDNSYDKQWGENLLYKIWSDYIIWQNLSVLFRPNRVASIYEFAARQFRKKGVRLTRYFQNSNSKKYLPPISRISFENMCYGGAKCGVNYDSKSGKI